jgi:hypothetical protein
MILYQKLMCSSSQTQFPHVIVLDIRVPFCVTSEPSLPLMMLTSFLIPATDSGSSCHAPDANASPGGNAPPPGKDPMLIDAETRVHTQVVKM